MDEPRANDAHPQPGSLARLTRGAAEMMREARQMLLFPPQLRIPALEEPAPEAPAGEEPGPAEPAGPLDRGTRRLLATLATGLWQSRRRVVGLEDGEEPPRELRALARRIEATWDAVHEQGLQIQDHTDQRYTVGMDLAVLTLQPTPGVQAERVSETLKPTVYVGDLKIQRGEVIVATPVGEDPETPAEGDSSGAEPLPEADRQDPS